MKTKTRWEERMKHNLRIALTMAVAGIAALAVFTPNLKAGAPLTCFPFQIGGAKSLPWDDISDPRNWKTPKSEYDTRRLADDTLMLLGDGTPVIVRMETIRRAAIYGMKDPAAAENLYALLKTRVHKSAKGQVNPLYLFDLGYAVETFKQAGLMDKSKKGIPFVSGEDGYSNIRQALALRGNDPQMEFAAAIVTVWPRREEHQDHFSKSVAGAAGDSLLTRNLLDHFAERGNSLTQLRASASITGSKN
jgi:hypothetical protein